MGDPCWILEAKYNKIINFLIQNYYLSNKFVSQPILSCKHYNTYINRQLDPQHQGLQQEAMLEY